MLFLNLCNFTPRGVLFGTFYVIFRLWTFKDFRRNVKNFKFFVARDNATRIMTNETRSQILDFEAQKLIIRKSDKNLKENNKKSCHIKFHDFNLQPKNFRNCSYEKLSSTLAGGLYVHRRPIYRFCRNLIR